MNAQLTPPAASVKPKRLVGRPSSVRPKWSDADRVEQKRRISGYIGSYGLPFVSDTMAERLRDECLSARDGSTMEASQRSQIPSLRFYKALLGLYQVCAKFKAQSGASGGGPIFFLELSDAEIAQILGWGRSTVAAGQRWATDWIGSIPRLGMADVSQHRQGKTETFVCPIKRTSLRHLTVYALTQLELTHRAGPQLIALHLLALGKSSYAEQQRLLFESALESSKLPPEGSDAIAEAQAAIGRLAASFGPAESELLTTWRNKPGGPPS